MSTKKVYRAIGLMSGTSLDGIDAALIETDGYGSVKPLCFVEHPYTNDIRDELRACLGMRCRGEQIMKTERLLTLEHAQAVKDLLKKAKLSPADIDVVGFHGQTILHDPAKRFSLQIGDCDLLARETDMDVVGNFRAADIEAGGQGAPLLPLYHQALAQAGSLPNPLVVLNIGGVSNVTYIDGDTLIAFDTGPGNALIDDFISERTPAPFDKGGAVAGAGTVNQDLITQWMKNPYFSKAAPKSLDRNEWDVSAVETMPFGDGTATLSAFTVAAIVKGASLLPGKAKQWLVTGGGRYNKFIMDGLRAQLGVPVDSVETVGWNGNTLEAEGFAYLAVRSLLGEPLSMPGTTGVSAPQTGGVLHKVA